MSFETRLETLEDDFAIEEIIETAFGPGRFAKTAYRIRESCNFQPLFGFVTENHLKNIVATIRIAYLDKNKPDIAFLGPIAVNSDLRNMGLGMALMKIAEQECWKREIKQIILIGDPEYYRKFGFTKMTHTNIILPHPINTNRIVIKSLTKYK
ncbi:MAG: putative N-acetyltransferase YhbS [Alphaproteobacteria bacterium]|jgi:predicted N-acetyltransferase YhbS